MERDTILTVVRNDRSHWAKDRSIKAARRVKSIGVLSYLMSEGSSTTHSI